MLLRSPFVRYKSGLKQVYRIVTLCPVFHSKRRFTLDIIYNPSGISDSRMGPWLDFASWNWDLRTKLDVTYQGTTSATTPGSGQILIKLATAGEWATHGAGNPAAATISNSSTSFTTFLNPNMGITSAHGELLTHEIGHSLGYFNFSGGVHSNDSDDIMYPTVGLGNFPISTMDAFGVNQYTSLSAADSPDIKSAILASDFDMFIPDINVNGSIRQIQLNYDGVVNLGTGNKHTWTIWSNVANEEGSGGSGSVSGTAVAIGGVQSMGTDYTSVVMEVVGSQVQLTSWV
jgi:hypothetical protein